MQNLARDKFHHVCMGISQLSRHFCVASENTHPLDLPSTIQSVIDDDDVLTLDDDDVMKNRTKDDTS